MQHVLFIILISIWIWITYSVFKSPCIDDEGWIIPESSAYDSLKKYIKSKLKW